LLLRCVWRRVLFDVDRRPIWIFWIFVEWRISEGRQCEAAGKYADTSVRAEVVTVKFTTVEAFMSMKAADVTAAKVSHAAMKTAATAVRPTHATT
jgi:hypothetical protein